VLGDDADAGAAERRRLGLSVDVGLEDSRGDAGAPGTAGADETPGAGAMASSKTGAGATRSRRGRGKEKDKGAQGKHAERRVLNDPHVGCCRGWRFTQLRRNQPGVEGENVYNVRTTRWKDLDKFVTMRRRGAEFTIKTPAAARLDVRAPPEVRLVSMTRALSQLGGSRPPTRAQTAPVNASASASLYYDDLLPPAGVASPQSRPATRAEGSYHSLERERGRAAGGVGVFSPGSRPATRAEGSWERERVRSAALYPDGRFQVAGSAGAMRDFLRMDSVGTPGQRSRTATSFEVATRAPRLHSAMRERPWAANMRRPARPLSTAEVLRLAAVAGLYSFHGGASESAKEWAGGGPGIAFFDAGD